MKAVALLGLLFVAYCEVQVARTWKRRSRSNLAIWFLILAGLGAWCVATLFR